VSRNEEPVLTSTDQHDTEHPTETEIAIPYPRATASQQTGPAGTPTEQVYTGPAGTPTEQVYTGPVPGTTATAPRLLLRVEEAAERLSISRTRMFAYLKSGAIESVKVGRLRRIPADALTAFVAHLTANQAANAA
jgi:excisionase family DNA binding protein